MATLKTEKIGRRRWRVIEDFRGVPAGFEFDGASVPRLFWPILDPASEGFEAACLHDFNLSRGIAWRTAAAALYLDLICYGVPRWRASIIYSAVRSWGLLTRREGA